MHLTGKYAAIFRAAGAETPEADMPIGTGDGVNKRFVLGETLDACDAVLDWTGTVLALDPVDKKEGAFSLTDTIPGAPGTYQTYWTVPAAGTIDISLHQYISIWIKCDVASAAMVSAQLRLGTTPGDYDYFDIVFLADTWTRIDVDIFNPDGIAGAGLNKEVLTHIGTAFDAGGVPYLLYLDWLSQNPKACKAITIKDSGVVVDNHAVAVSPSGIVEFETAPAGANDITADYTHYATLTQIAGAYEWNTDSSADMLETTKFESLGAKEFIAGNIGWTGGCERRWETGDVFNSGDAYVVRYYITLDVDNPVWYEGWTKVSSNAVNVPQNEVVAETLAFQGTGRLFWINKT